MRKIHLTLISLLISSASLLAQYKMEISASYNVPSSSEFSNEFKNGFGATGEIFYFFEDSDFSTSIILGVNSFRGTEESEQALKEENPTLFEYDYEIHYNTFPVLLSANYTFMSEKKFNIMLGFGAGIQFMEHKKKLIGKYTSDTQKETSNEFAIKPSLVLSYAITKGIAISVKGSYNNTMGQTYISYYSFNLGMLYNI